MRFIVLLSIIFLSSCQNKKETIVKRQQAIQQEIEQVKAFYYNKSDSLENIKRTDTSAARKMEMAAALVSAEREKNQLLIPLQKEYDSLAAALPATVTPIH